MRSSHVFMAALMLVCPSAVALAGSVSLIGLGNFAGATEANSVANGVSFDGSVVVGMAGAPTNRGRAFRWTAATGLVALDDLPGANNNAANAVSSNGATAVGYSFNPSEGSLGFKAVRWNSSGGATDTGIFGEAYGVNRDGSVIVGDDRGDGVRYTAPAGIVRLGTLSPNGGSSSHAADVSADGAVVVGSSYGQAFRWTAETGMVGLGDLTGTVLQSDATGVSADGSVVVGNGTSTSVEAFRWTKETGMVGLGNVPGLTFNTRATDVSADGNTIVGYGYNGGTDDGDRDYDAIVWTQDLGMQRVWDVLVAGGFDPADDGWTQLNEAFAISGDGTTIVGRGIHNGNYEAFVARIGSPAAVPLPAAIWPAGALLAGIAGRRALRRRPV